MSSRRGFTLVEMLVVMGIIAVLIALLMPAVMSAVGRARNTRMAVELKQLGSAIEAYKQDKGDYPPNFRDYNVFLRHVRRCYPKIDNTKLNTFIAGVWGTGKSVTSPPAATDVPTIDEGESLVVWLSMIDTDPRDPFKYLTTGSGNSLKKYYEFDANRLIDETTDADTFPSYRPAYAKETFYIYIDSRSYQLFVSDLSSGSSVGASAEDATTNFVRPYWSETLAAGYTAASTAAKNLKFKPMNATTFQVICAGQDGLFGVPATDVKQFPGGAGYDLVDRGDHDNITSFSDGKQLQDALP